MDPHKLLGVSEAIDAQALQARFRVLSKMFHPDRHKQDPTAVVVFQLLTEAHRLVHEMKTDPAAPRLAARHSVPLAVPARGGRADAPDAPVTSTAVGERLTDPYFAPSFALSDYFGDVTIKRSRAK